MLGFGVLRGRAKEIMKMKDQQKPGSEWYQLALMLHANRHKIKPLLSYLKGAFKDLDFLNAMLDDPELVIYTFADTMFRRVEE